VEAVKINMQFVGKFNTQVVLTDMYVSEEDPMVKEKYYKKLKALSYEIIEYDYALLKL
jgi:hypothetical protein